MLGRRKIQFYSVCLLQSPNLLMKNDSANAGRCQQKTMSEPIAPVIQIDFSGEKPSKVPVSSTASTRYVYEMSRFKNLSCVRNCPS